MSSRTAGDEKTSKLGVLVPETVQDDNRALVKYRNEGSIRNKLGPGTTRRITLGLAMYFWRHPEELQKVADSEYVDDPDEFIERINRYQEEHIEDVLVVARRLLHGEDNVLGSSQADQQRRLGGVPRISEAPQNRTIRSEERREERNQLRNDLQKVIHEQVEDVRMEMESELADIEAKMGKLEQQVDAGSTDS